MFHTTLAVAIVSRRDFTVRIPRRVKRPSEICSRGNGRPRCSIGWIDLVVAKSAAQATMTWPRGVENE
jgi:hypothetical protein